MSAAKAEMDESGATVLTELGRLTIFMLTLWALHASPPTRTTSHDRSLMLSAL